MTPSGMVGSSKISCVSTGTPAAPIFLGDTRGGSKFFSSSFISTSGGDGGGIMGWTLRALGILNTGPKEVGRSTLDGALATKFLAPASCTSGLVANTCVSWPPISGGRSGLYGVFCGAFKLTYIFFIFFCGSTGFKDIRNL